jgi:hypothetical protein
MHGKVGAQTTYYKNFDQRQVIQYRYVATHTIEQYALVNAARHDDLKQVRQLLEKYTDVNQQNSAGRHCFACNNYNRNSKTTIKTRRRYQSAKSLSMYAYLFSSYLYRQDIVQLLLDQHTLVNSSAK